MKYSHFLFLLLSLTVFSIQGYSQKIIDQIVAVVGDDMIKQSDIENQFIQLKQQNQLLQESDKCIIFEELLLQKLLLDQAKIDSIEVSDDEIQAEITRRIDAYTGQTGSMSKIEAFYGKSELEIRTEWKPLIKDQILSQRMKGTIVGDVEVSPNEVKKYYMTIPKDSLALIPVQYEFAQIVIKPIFTSNEDIEIRKKLEDIRQRAISGENFSKLAVLYSDDTESAKNGGSLGDYMSRGELVPEFAAVAFRLKDGEISRIVKTDFGYHIIQMIELKGEKAKLKHILIRPKVSTIVMQNTLAKADSIYALLKDTLTFSKAAALYSVDNRTKYNGGVYINPYTGSSKFQEEMIEPSLFFGLKKMKVGQISEPILSFDDTGAQVYKIVKLNSVTPEHKATLVDDYQSIKELALEDKKDTILTKWINDKKERTFISLPESQFRNCTFKYGIWNK